ncbi:MAG: UDP-N-acetylmuramate:L-alanyl-gamma-D-glutamyl-meso-diaminopimelate ligase [Rhodocyclaceae bacterium]|nr:UDP-N-acetylmuramate:L-alanyl-gamma-D-glutamyl-meso-diaminopimelate ligase [Rhodocyclaceae bacterium]
MHIHILGICGTFMGGIALIARAAGHRVTGCDANVYPPMSAQLEAEGIQLVEGYGADQLALAPDLYVIGNAISRGNPLLEEILERGLPYVSGPQWLGENVLRDKWVLAVSGTHGKTTTTSMLAWILEHAGLAPGFLVGGVPKNFGVSARLTASRYFVIEADEYDTAFCDKRSKFLHYRPRTLIINNIEFDHADIFADLGAIETQFHHLVRTLARGACVVAHAADASIERVLARGLWSQCERFGAAEAWSLSAAADGAAAIAQAGRPLGDLQLAMPGRHNQENALAALVAARHAGVAPDLALAAMARFEGVKRRLELLGTPGGVAVYDDFAHHPTAIAATLAALRARVGEARILAVFEPRSNTMKLGTMKDQLPGALFAADMAFCYGADLGWDAGQVLAPLGERAEVSMDIADLVARVRRAAHAGDHVLIMSNGGFGGLHGRLLAALA